MIDPTDNCPDVDAEIVNVVPEIAPVPAKRVNTCVPIAGVLKALLFWLYQVVFAKRYTKVCEPPAESNTEPPPTIDWPVFAFTVKAVICCVDVIVMFMPSTGEAGIVTVPVANVPAGTANKSCAPGAKV
jgi:hypothetical protein